MQKEIENYHQFLDKEYTDIKELGTQELRTKGIIPSAIRLLEDKRRSLDLYYSFTPDARQIIEEQVLGPARKLFERLKAPQIIFGADWLHVSLLVIMAAEIQPPFDPAKEDIKPYQEIAKRVISNHSHFSVQFSRLIPFPGGILLGGFPETVEVNQVRQELRKQIDQRGLRRFERRPLQIFHATAVRWDTRLEPNQTEEVINFTNELDEKPIWDGYLDTVIFTVGGYNASPANTRIYDEFKLL